MSKIHVYLKPFIDDAGTGYVTDWVEVTNDVLELGSLTQQLDNTEYDIGIFRTSAMKLKLRNDDGDYQDVDSIGTIFKYKRGNTKVKVTWEPGNGPLVLGFFTLNDPEAILSDEVDVFEGLLDDTATTSDIELQTVEFSVLGYESVLAGMVVPYSGISNGDSIAATLYAICNQSPLNTLVTVSLANFSTGAAATLDAKASLENKTALEGIRELLKVSSSVLYIQSGVLYSAPRTAETALSYTFYGQGSPDGIENIQKISKYRGGENRIFNFVTWQDTTIVAQDATSVAKFGARKKEISSDIFTDNAKRTTLVTAIKDEFANRKREFDLDVVVDPDTLALFLLDRVKVDYPASYVPNENENVAIYGIGEYGVDYYAQGLYPLTIESTARFKIMNRKIDFKKETITLALREI